MLLLGSTRGYATEGYNNLDAALPFFVAGELNGGKFTALTQADWELILPYLQENERLFGIKVEDLLTVEGRACKPEEVYRRISPVALKALAKAAALPGKEKKQAAKA